VRRSLLSVAGLAAGALAGVAFLRRGATRRRERVDLYFADGSMVSFAEGSPEAVRLLSVARRILAQEQ
jgi:hypothetical protein